MNTTDFLSISSAICPERAAIIFEDNRYTFSQLNERVNRLANAMNRLGVKKGDRVALLQVNCNQCIEVYFATAKLDAIYLPLNFRSKEEEQEYMINFAEPTIIFVGSRYADMINSIRPKLRTVKNYVCIDGEYKDMLNYEELLRSSPADESSIEIADEENTILMFTAGTTGKPKGVMLPHKSFSVYVLENVSPPTRKLMKKLFLRCLCTTSLASRR